MCDTSQRGECESTTRRNAAETTIVGEEIEKYNFVSGGPTAASGSGGSRDESQGE